jgi:hypothetical protein
MIKQISLLPALITNFYTQNGKKNPKLEKEEKEVYGDSRMTVLFFHVSNDSIVSLTTISTLQAKMGQSICDNFTF